MKPSQPDDAGSPSRSGHKPVPPAVVYALDCLERQTPAQVNRHLVALGYSREEAADALRQAQVQRGEDRPSAWSPEDAAARRYASLGFMLFLLGVVFGCMWKSFVSPVPGGVAVAVSLFTWGCIVAGIAIFWIGIAHMRIRRD
jgi:hypothetical protein